MKKSWKKFLQIFVLCLSVFGQTGCVYLGIGALGAGVGYMVSPDTIDGVVPRTYAQVWDAAHREMEINGFILEEYRETGFLSAKVDGVTVTIIIEPTEQEQETYLSVKARYSVWPKVNWAQDIYEAILNQLDIS